MRSLKRVHNAKKCRVEDKEVCIFSLRRKTVANSGEGSFVRRILRLTPKKNNCRKPRNDFMEKFLQNMWKNKFQKVLVI